MRFAEFEEKVKEVERARCVAPTAARAVPASAWHAQRSVSMPGGTVPPHVPRPCFTLHGYVAPFSSLALLWACTRARRATPALPNPSYHSPTHFGACRAIYKYALDHLPKSQAGELYRRFVQFEKQQGDREGIEVRPPCWRGEGAMRALPARHVEERCPLVHEASGSPCGHG